jgi:hypothetical protein
MENPCNSLNIRESCINIVAKSGNREENINNVLKEVCGDNIQYRYWYGSGLWLIKIYSSSPDDIDIEKIERELRFAPLDSCMIFYGNHEIFDNTFIRYYNSLEPSLFPEQSMKDSKNIYKTIDK